MLILDSGEATARVSLVTGALVAVTSATAADAAQAWRVLDRSPVSARIETATGSQRVELRYELDGTRLTVARTTAAGTREISVIDVGAAHEER